MLLAGLKGEEGFRESRQAMHMQVILLDRRSSFQKCLSRISVGMPSSPSGIAYSRYIPLVRSSSLGSSISSGEVGCGIDQSRNPTGKVSVTRFRDGLKSAR